MAPLPICYLNGEYGPLREARVSPLDRAFLFGDAVYEVIPVYGARPFRLRAHLERLDRSCAAIRLSAPLTHAAWGEVCEELVRRNGGADQYLYLQVTRGAEFGRNHAWPAGLAPTLFAYANALEAPAAALYDEGLAAITAPETRWARRDIKSTALLANVLAKKLATEAGAYETIFLENGELTEGSSTTVHVIFEGTVHTPPNGPRILPGTTRSVVEELAHRLGIEVRSAPVSEAQLRGAQEIWLAFSTRGLLPVTSLDARPVGSGRPGALFRRMHQAFLDYIEELAGTPAL